MTTTRPGEPLDGADGGPGPSAWPATRRRKLREVRRYECIPDPTRPGKRIHPSASCPHGTEGGYTNWGCECAIIPGTTTTPGCEPIAVAAANQRKANRRAPPVTPQLPATINLPTGPTQPDTPAPAGRHRKTD